MLPDKLQPLVDELRAQLGQGFGVLTSIDVEGSRERLLLDVSPDGITWLVRLTLGERVLFDSAVEPKAFLSNLYVFLGYAIREAQGRGPKRVGPN